MVKTREKGGGGVLWLIISDKLYSPSCYDQLTVYWSVSWVRNQSSWQSTKCFNCPQTLEEANNFFSFFVFLSLLRSILLLLLSFFSFFFYNEGRRGGLDSEWVRVLARSLCCVLGHNNSLSLKFSLLTGGRGTSTWEGLTSSDWRGGGGEGGSNIPSRFMRKKLG